MTALVLDRPRRLRSMLVVALVTGVLASTVAVAPALAADDQLRLAVATTYRVDPAEHAVHATLDITATNQKPDTATTYYWYDTVTLGVPAEARSIHSTSGGKRLTVTTQAHTSFRDVVIHMPNLYHGKTRKMQLTFDLPSGKPRSDSRTRVGQAHAAFDAWAWGDAGLGDVRIVLPPAFIADIETEPSDSDAQLASTVEDGRKVYSVKHLADPVGWYSAIEASNREALTNVSIEAGGNPIEIHAWPEDGEWVERVSTVLQDSLPDLEAAIGLPWPVEGDLDVTEVTSSELEGYAGFFDPSYESITISEDLDDLVIVHEASHAWFDDSLFQERWIGEGLADEYASRILAAEHGDAPEDPLPVAATDKAAFALNTWRPPGRIDSDESEAYERFGYDASWTVMRAIVDDVTEARMRAVFKAAAARTLTYAGVGPAETYAYPPDWRRFLDLVTDVGGSTEAESLLKTWVLTPEQTAEVSVRDTVRTRYFALVEAGDDWLPGILIRKPMNDWRFTDATAALSEAETVVAARDRLEVATTELDLAFPGGLEPAYEAADATEDLTALETRIADWTAAAAAIRTARDELAKERPPLVALGLYDTNPGAGYDAALAAFAAGDDKGVLAGSAATVAALAGAEEIGRGRATMAGVGVAIVLVLLVLLVIVAIRRRRRRAPALAATAAGEVGVARAAGTVAWSDPFAMTAPYAATTPAMAASDVPPPPVGVVSLVAPPGSAPPGYAPPVPPAPPAPPRPPAFDAADVPPPPTEVRRLGAGPAEDTYATLAATPDPAEGSEAGAPRARGADSD